MASKARLPQSSRHIMVYDEDWEFLTKHYGDGAHPARNIGNGPACREIIHSHIQAIKRRRIEAIDSYLDQESQESPINTGI